MSTIHFDGVNVSRHRKYNIFEVCVDRLVSLKNHYSPKHVFCKLNGYEILYFCDFMIVYTCLDALCADVREVGGAASVFREIPE